MKRNESAVITARVPLWIKDALDTMKGVSRSNKLLHILCERFGKKVKK